MSLTIPTSGYIGCSVIGSAVIGADSADVFPAADTVYLAFWDVLPDPDGTGGNESLPVRVEYADGWLDTPIGRVNREAMEATFSDEDASLAYGFWSEAVGGFVLAWGELPIEFSGLLGGITWQIEPGGVLITCVSQLLANIYTDDYKAPFMDLLPYGPAWNRREGSTLTKLLTGLAREPSRVEYGAGRAIEENDPRTTQELLADWERFAGLPDCGPPPATIAERQVLLAQKLTQNTSPTPQAFQDLVESLGYTGVIVDTNVGDPFEADSNCNDTLMGGEWMYAWSITTDQSTANDSLMVCLVGQLAPLHGQVIFFLGP